MKIEFNKDFLSTWLEENHCVRKDILVAINQKDYNLVNKWLAGEQPSVKYIVRFCNYYQVPIDRWFAIDEDKEPDGYFKRSKVRQNYKETEEEKARQAMAKLATSGEDVIPRAVHELELAKLTVKYEKEKSDLVTKNNELVSKMVYNNRSSLETMKEIMGGQNATTEAALEEKQKTIDLQAETIRSLQNQVATLDAIVRRQKGIQIRPGVISGSSMVNETTTEHGDQP